MVLYDYKKTVQQQTWLCIIAMRLLVCLSKGSHAILVLLVLKMLLQSTYICDLHACSICTGMSGQDETSGSGVPQLLADGKW